MSLRAKIISWSLTLCFIVAAPAAGAEPSTAPSAPAQWGKETLAKIQSAFFIPSRGLYAGEAESAKPRPAWVWDASIQLGALCAAARVEPAQYLPRVKAYAAALRAYRTTYHDRPGLDVNPPPKPTDRYYDDNAWICLSLLEAYELTHDQKDMDLAMDAYRFAMSGTDDALGGGIYWHEDRPTSKNACSSGPTMLAAMKLYKITKDKKYLETTLRLYDWTKAHLQDTDGLVFDSIAVPAGSINRAKYTYNSATLIRAACALHQATGDQQYLDEAQRVAKAAEKRFVREDDGIISGAAKLGVKLVEAFLDLYSLDHDEHWKSIVQRCLTSLREHRDANGWYPQSWQSTAVPGKPARLIDQAAPARAFWLLAGVK